MPKSKRDRIVHLTKTDKKGKEKKTKLVEAIRDCVDSHSRIYAFGFSNMRTAKFKDLRAALKDSRFFLGKNKVMQLALGRTPEEEYREGLGAISKLLVGNVGLLFSNRAPSDLNAVLEEHVELDYARSGSVATKTVTLAAGPLPEMQHTMVEELRTLGLPVELKRGVVTLYAPHTICKKGDVLSPEQCRLLKHFWHPMAEFRVTLLACWSDGETQVLHESARRGAGEEKDDGAAVEDSDED
mmetsp:Transcript_14958/g.47694  ORF Transcript_14958/g.47694 Transcript_14958/m.47694 type:complete len:241 (+) Transcript_14958:34-756(+)